MFMIAIYENFYEVEDGVFYIMRRCQVDGTFHRSPNLFVYYDIQLAHLMCYVVGLFQKNRSLVLKQL